MALQGQTLQQRKPAAAGPPVSAEQASGHTGGPARGALPLAAEGEYRWGESGEVINLYVEGGELHGYMTRRSDRRNAGSAPMTFHFAQASTTGDQLSFATSHIHGDWYSFTGHVVRGTAATPREDGYYLLVGTLQIHLDAPGADSAPETDSTQAPAAGTIARPVSLKLSASSRVGSAP